MAHVSPRRLGLPLPGVPNPRPGRVVTGSSRMGPSRPSSETSVATHDTSRSTHGVPMNEAS